MAQEGSDGATPGGMPDTTATKAPMEETEEEAEALMFLEGARKSRSWISLWRSPSPKQVCLEG